MPGGLQVVAVVGPTGCGKSQLSLDIVERLSEQGWRAEIINADSMQVYRGMDIGTAKVSVSERRGIPHHLLDIWDVTQGANVADYQRQARRTIADILSRGALPILVGGSGLYIRAVLDDLRFPGTDPQLRARLQADLDELGAAELHARLARIDPSAAASILASNGRRIVRALEVIELSGGPFTAELPPPRPVYRQLEIGLDDERAELDRRLADRVDVMWRLGLVDEVRHLAGLPGSPTASRALGYAQVLAMLAGQFDEQSARERTVAATRKFARRQRSWFRRDGGIRWLPADVPDRVALAVEMITSAGPLSTEPDAAITEPR